MSIRVDVARKNVEIVEASLADIRDRIAPFRRAYYGTRELIRDRCVTVDSIREAIVEWRPPSRDDIAELDAAAELFREHTEHLIPEENRIKAALREAQWVLRDVEYAEKKAARDAARKPKSDIRSGGNGQLNLL